jgi:NADPH:quinone reductase-like Zn-dependent oxidoreductase
MARAIRFHETGGPEVLRIDEVPTPEPKAGEVRIRVHALGLNRADSMFRTGRYVIEPQFPASFGYEAAGTIDAVGPGVEGFIEGDRVAVIPAFMFDEYALFADLAIAPARAVVKLPDNVTWENAAATWMPLPLCGRADRYRRLARRRLRGAGRGIKQRWSCRDADRASRGRDPHSHHSRW